MLACISHIQLDPLFVCNVEKPGDESTSKRGLHYSVQLLCVVVNDQWQLLNTECQQSLADRRKDPGIKGVVE